MLIMPTVIESARLGVNVRWNAFAAPLWRGLIDDTRGIVTDELMMPGFVEQRANRAGRNGLFAMLAGCGRLRLGDDERWLVAGDVAFVKGLGAYRGRVQNQEHTRWLALEWEPGTLADLRSDIEMLRLDARGLRALEEAAIGLESSSTATVSHALHLGLALLRQEGAAVEVPSSHELALPVDPKIMATGILLGNII